MSINTDTEKNISSTVSDIFTKPSAQEPDYPQLDINNLDEILLQELEVISTELSVVNSTKRGQKVKKRLFVCSNDGEPNTKRRRTGSFTETDADIEFIWTSSDSAGRSWEYNGRVWYMKPLFALLVRSVWIATFVIMLIDLHDKSNCCMFDNLCTNI